jgi:hypothetical protein
MMRSPVSILNPDRGKFRPVGDAVSHKGIMFFNVLPIRSFEQNLRRGRPLYDLQTRSYRFLQCQEKL